MSETDYQKRVFDYLDDIGVNSIIIVDNICNGDSKWQFVECVKKYIDNMTGDEDYVVEFNEDYSKIRKI